MFVDIGSLDNVRATLKGRSDRQVKVARKVHPKERALARVVRVNRTVCIGSVGAHKTAKDCDVRRFGNGGYILREERCSGQK